MEVLKENKNMLLGRKEVEVVIESDGNPGIAGVTKELAGKFKADENAIVVDRLMSSFGKSKFNVEAKIYDSEEAKKEVEVRNKKKKKEAAK